MSTIDRANGERRTRRRRRRSAAPDSEASPQPGAKSETRAGTDTGSRPRVPPLPPAGAVLASDRARLIGLRRRLCSAGAGHRQRLQEQYAALVGRSTEAVERRRAALPRPRFDESLPIHAHAEKLVQLIQHNQVVIVEGETGSGKTTQLPKIALAAGRGASGQIGCTQPRRIAARSVARRVAEELDSPIGEAVGYQVRFDTRTGADTTVKFMTDGILLAEVQNDRWLRAYDTLIIDEAHERSLNIDFLLGLLKRLLQKRDDLKVIITSATIDSARFSQFFDGAPVLAIEGRSYPVERRYRPLAERERDDRGLAAAIADTVAEISREDGQGDILVFLPGEREIRDAHKVLAERSFAHTSILPLYARLGARDQDRVFKPGIGRRIVLATNVAETSLTVPRIRYVIDSGTARISRYSTRSKVQRLEIEPIARANAEQRAGRCGRLGPGVCYRLYDEQDFLARPEFADPEILRSSLANVILRMLALGLGAIDRFPFVDPPSDRAIRDGVQQLQELQAISGDQHLTDTGRALARFPIDVQLARMLVEAQRLGSLRELLIIVAFLGVQDPRERPHEARALADSRHAEYADRRSDFLGALKLWQDWDAARSALGSSRQRAWCQERFLNYMRMREWRELHRQLLPVVESLGWAIPAKPADYEAIHRAVLAGLPTSVARKGEKGLYEGTRSRGFALFPGSALAKSAPNWLLSLSVIVTSRQYAHGNARIEPQWLYDQAGHLLKRTVFEPHWDRDRGRVIAYEQATLYGLVIHGRKRVDYAHTDPAGAHRIFLLEGLAECNLDSRSDFVDDNARVLERAFEEEARQRRQGLVIDGEQRAQLLAPLIPETIASTRDLDRWYRSLPQAQRKPLRWRLEDLLATPTREQAFPAQIELAGHRFALDYLFEPGNAADGVTLTVPLAWLNALPLARLEWLVPGLLKDKVAELIRSLPKSLRRNFVPAPDFAQAFVEAQEAADRPLLAALSAWMEKTSGIAVADTDFQPGELPAHLVMRLRLLDEAGRDLACSRDGRQLQRQYGARARAAFAARAGTGLARTGLTRFEPGQLPESVVSPAGLRAWPAFVDRGEHVDLVVFESADKARQAHAGGIRRLLLLHLADPRRRLARQLPLDAKAQFTWAAIGSLETLRRDIVDQVVGRSLGDEGAAVRDLGRFRQLAGDITADLGRQATARALLVEAALHALSPIGARLSPPLMGFAAANFDDIREQLTALFPADLGRRIDDADLAEYPRYLKAVSLRVERLQQDPRKDQERMLVVRDFQDRLAALPERQESAAARRQLWWLLQELRVSLFAQELGTRQPVSEKRVERRLQALEQGRVPA